MATATIHTALVNFGLHHFALLGDDEGVRRALREGADINALDTFGRTAVMCAVAGDKYASFTLTIDASLTVFCVAGTIPTRVTRPLCLQTG